MTSKQERESIAIRDVVAHHPEGLSRGEIAKFLNFSIENKTLQRRLHQLIETGEITKSGERRATRYYPPHALLGRDLGTKQASGRDKIPRIFSEDSRKALKYLDIQVFSRPQAAYNRTLLDEYVPNETAYVPIALRQVLHQNGQRVSPTLTAGTYARHICQRLLIDLSYNSCRLEGNTYSELDTRRLVEDGISAKGKVHAETVMIMNHKEAILFLVENAQDIEPSPFTIYNLHHLLSQDLLANPAACGNIRTLRVEIGKSSYTPLDNPHQLKECFELLLLKARRIEDPFEQSFFLLIHLSYLQAFEDVNKRTARLTCNIPLIKSNLCPLSFTGVPTDDYLAALLMIYELNNYGPMLDVFHWAYLRSCEHYDVVKDSLGEIDPFRIEYRQQRKYVMGQVILNGLHGKELERHIKNYCRDNNISNADIFTAMALADLSNLHEGAIVGLGITKNQFEDWKNKSKNIS